MSTVERIYNHSPLLVQNLMVSAYGLNWYILKYSGNFRRYYQELRDNEWLALEELEEIQLEKLQLVLHQAYHYIPYYHKMFVDHGLHPKDIEGLSDLKKLPLLEKDVLRKDSTQLVAKNIPGRRICHGRTSGTTGTPLTLYAEKEAWKKNYAFHEARSRNWAGVSIKDRRAMIGGRRVVPVRQIHPPFWRYNVVEGQIYLSAYHLSSENIKHYADAICEFWPAYIAGYTSAIFIMAQVIKEHGYKRPKLRAVIVSGERLYPDQREVIQEVFECKVYDQWGNGEKVGFASECEKGGMHLSPEYGIVEILRGNRDAEPGELGEMICTGLLDNAMPLIRYRVGDVGIPSDSKCSCGRELPLVESIEGKINDVLVTPEGRYVSLLSGSVFPHTANVEQGQIIQEDVDHIVVKIVPDINFSAADKESLMQDMRSLLGGAVQFDVEEVDEIPRTEAGKFRGVISKVPLTLN